ncbi:MAG TPA: phosphoethanolamine transferase domain-containing protein [Steroidobacteraceae bacterium]|nr:phosphoethanolamine transferase domain-containing protein [Steroidobacteraceae bacterium]
MKTSHVRFVIGFSILLYVVCNTVNFGRLSMWFRQGDGYDYSALTAYLVAGLCLFIAFFALVAHRWTIKPLAILLTVLSCAVTYFIAKYGVAIDSSMIQNTVHTDVTEVGQLLSWQMIPYVVFLIVVPVLVIWRTEITFRASASYLLGSLTLFVVAFGLALGCLFLEYNAILRAGNVSNKYILYSLVPLNVIQGSLNAAAKSVKPYLKRSEQAVEFDASVSSPGNLVVVLAVGESSRKKNFSLYGYTRRNTNPVLAKTPDLHLLNGVATRASTLYALPKILEKDGVKLTAVVSKAGVPTSCYVNYTLYDNCAIPGETAVTNCGHGGKCYDEDVIPLLQKNLASYASGYRFVVLHLGGGSHGPLYSDRYPPEFQQFKPMCTDADVTTKCTLDQLYNSYDNTIAYVDHVVGQALQALDQSGVPYVFIYLSDHGESLMEDGVMFHGMPPGMALPAEQAQIPLIVKASVPVAVLERAEYGQPAVFDTVLDLFSIQSSKFDRAESFIQKSSLTSAAQAQASSPASSR